MPELFTPSLHYTLRIRLTEAVTFINVVLLDVA